MKICGFLIADCGLCTRFRRAAQSLSANPQSEIRDPKSAFTLIELVLVLAVLALMMSAAAPHLRGWGRGGKVRDATDQVLTAIRFAQSQAIHDFVTCRLSVNPVDDALEVWRIDGQRVAPATGEFHDPVEVPDGFSIEIERFDGAGNAAIEFLPDGRLTPGRIEIIAPWGERTIIESRWPAQPLRLISEGGGR